MFLGLELGFCKVRSWVTHYVYENPHDNRSKRMSVCVCVCGSDLVSDHTDYALGVKEDGIPVKGSI